MSRPTTLSKSSPQKSSQSAYSRAAAVAHATSSDSRRSALNSLETAEYHLSQAARISVDSSGRTCVPSKVSSTKFVKDLEVTTQQPSVHVLLHNIANDVLVDTLASQSQPRRDTEDHVERQSSSRSREAQLYNSSQGILVEPLLGTIPVDQNVQLQATQNVRSMQEQLLSTHGSFNDLQMHGKPVGGGGVVAQGLGRKWKAYHQARDTLRGDRIYTLQGNHQEVKDTVQPSIQNHRVRKTRNKKQHPELRNVGVQVSFAIATPVEMDRREFGCQTEPKVMTSVGIGNSSLTMSTGQMEAQEGFYTEMRELATSEESLRKKVRQQTFQNQTNVANQTAKEDCWKSAEQNYKNEIEILRRKVGKLTEEKNTWNSEKVMNPANYDSNPQLTSNTSWSKLEQSSVLDTSGLLPQEDSQSLGRLSSMLDGKLPRVSNSIKEEEKNEYVREFHQALVDNRTYMRVRSKSVSRIAPVGLHDNVIGDISQIGTTNGTNAHLFVSTSTNLSDSKDTTDTHDVHDTLLHPHIHSTNLSPSSGGTTQIANEQRKEIEQQQDQQHRMKNMQQQQRKSSFLKEQKKVEMVHNQGNTDENMKNKYLQHYGTRLLTEETLVGESVSRSARGEDAKKASKLLPVSGSAGVYRTVKDTKAAHKKEQEKKKEREEQASMQGNIPVKPLPKKPAMSAEDRNQALLMRAMGKLETGQVNLVHGSNSKRDEKQKKQNLQRLTHSTSSSSLSSTTPLGIEMAVVEESMRVIEEEGRSSSTQSTRAREGWSKQQPRMSASQQMGSRWEEKRKEEQERQLNVILRSVDEGSFQEESPIAALAQESGDVAALMQGRQRALEDLEEQIMREDRYDVTPEEQYGSRGDSEVLSITPFQQQHEASHSYVFTGEDVQEHLRLSEQEAQNYMQSSLEQSGISLEVDHDILDQLDIDELENIPQMSTIPKRKSATVQFQLPFIFSPLSAKTFSQETIHNIPLHMLLNSKPKTKKHTPKSRK